MQIFVDIKNDVIMLYWIHGQKNKAYEMKE